MTTTANLVNTDPGAPADFNSAIWTWVEARLADTPPVADADSDGFLDATPATHQGPTNTNVNVDNCSGVANAGQQNNDGDFIDLSPPKGFDDVTSAMSDSLGDACDADDDNDGRSDIDELTGDNCGAFTGPTSRTVMDTDGDYVIDGAECALGFDPNSALSKPSPSQCGPATDADGDRLPAYREFCNYGTSDQNVNTDNDLCSDPREIASVNADQTVNAIDLGQVAQSFGNSNNPGYIANFDFTRDGNINAIDLAQVAQRFGSCP